DTAAEPMASYSCGHSPTRKHITLPPVDPRRRIKASVIQPSQPRRSWKQPLDVTIAFDARGPIDITEQKCVRDLERRVVRIGIPAPFQIPQAASVRAVLSAVR